MASARKSKRRQRSTGQRKGKDNEVAVVEAPEGCIEPPYSVRPSYKYGFITIVVSMHKIPPSHIVCEPTATHFHAHTLSYSRKLWLRFPYPNGIQVGCEDDDVVAEFDRGVLKVRMPMLRANSVPHRETPDERRRRRAAQVKARRQREAELTAAWALQKAEARAASLAAATGKSVGKQAGKGHAKNQKAKKRPRDAKKGGSAKGSNDFDPLQGTGLVGGSSGAAAEQGEKPRPKKRGRRAVKARARVAARAKQAQSGSSPAAAAAVVDTDAVLSQAVQHAEQRVASKLASEAERDAWVAKQGAKAQQRRRKKKAVVEGMRERIEREVRAPRVKRKPKTGSTPVNDAATKTKKRVTWS